MTAHAHPVPRRVPISARRAGNAAFALVLMTAVAATILLHPGLVPAPVAWVVVSGASMEPTLSNGDVVLTRTRDSYRVGDVVAYRVPDGPGRGALVIHRIDGGSAQEGYLLKGDNKQGRDPWRPRPEHVVGKMTVRVPAIGAAVSALRTPTGIAAVAALLTFLIALGGAPRNWRDGATQEPPRERAAPASSR